MSEQKYQAPDCGGYAAQGTSYFFLFISVIAGAFALGIGIYWSPIVAGSIALLSAYIGIWLVCHRCYKAQWVLVHLLFCCAIILLLASALFARQYVNFQVVASSNSFSLSMRYEQTNDRTIAFYNKCCVNNFPNVVPARSCSDISSTSDCYGDIPNLGGSCACYINEDTYTQFLNETTEAQCSRLAATGSPSLVGPPALGGCGSLFYYNGSSVLYFGVPKQFQNQFYYAVGNVLFVPFIILLVASCCFLLFIFLHCFFLCFNPGLGFKAEPDVEKGDGQPDDEEKNKEAGEAEKGEESEKEPAEPVMEDADKTQEQNGTEEAQDVVTGEETQTPIAEEDQSPIQEKETTNEATKEEKDASENINQADTESKEPQAGGMNDRKGSEETLQSEH